MQAGVSGYLVKQSAARELVAAIREVHKGNAYFSPSVARVFISPLASAVPKAPDLTLREREVLQLISSGKSNKEISTALDISVKTVEKYRQQVMDKLEIHDAVGLTRFALSHGLDNF